MAAIGSIRAARSAGIPDVARTREIGIRIALGADRRRVERAVIGEGMGLVGVGAVLGVVGALACTRVLQSLLFELSPADPVT